MIMLRLTVLLAVVSTATAVPALVWKPEPTETVYTSSQVKPEELLQGVGVGSSAVVFLLARSSSSGSDALTELAPQLSRTAESQPAEVHNYVTEMRNGNFLKTEASKMGHTSLVVNLSELAAKLSPKEEEIVMDASGIMSKAQIKKTKRTKQLEEANVLIVNVDSNVDPLILDQAVMNAVQHESVDNVMLTAVRSIDEVKHERRMIEQRRLQAMEKAGRKLLQSQQRRRLEDAADQDGEAANGDNNDNNLEGVYYVSLTPNILAGILFFLLFSTVAFIGISCMGMITGQDLYVTKMPSVGREA